MSKPSLRERTLKIMKSLGDYKYLDDVVTAILEAVTSSLPEVGKSHKDHTKYCDCNDCLCIAGRNGYRDHMIKTFVDAVKKIKEKP